MEAPHRPRVGRHKRTFPTNVAAAPFPSPHHRTAAGAGRWKPSWPVRMAAVGLHPLLSLLQAGAAAAGQRGPPPGGQWWRRAWPDPGPSGRIRGLAAGSGGHGTGSVAGRGGGGATAGGCGGWCRGEVAVAEAAGAVVDVVGLCLLDPASARRRGLVVASAPGRRRLAAARRQHDGEPSRATAGTRAARRELLVLAQSSWRVGWHPISPPLRLLARGPCAGPLTREGALSGLRAARHEEEQQHGANGHGGTLQGGTAAPLPCEGLPWP
jgi:hypothetical protein